MLTVAGTASGTAINSGGMEVVTSGGVASATTISGGTLEIKSGGSTGADAVTFAPGGGILQLDSALTFGGLVAGFGSPDLLDLRDIAFISGTTSATWTQSDTSSGTLAVTDSSHTANITMLGQYAADQFTAATDGHAGTVVTSIPPTLVINQIAGDDVVNAAEAQQSLSIGGTARGLSGQTVTVTFNGNQYAAQIAGDNTWSVALPSGALTTETLPDGSYQVAAQVNRVGGAIQATRALVIHETPPPTPVFDLSKSDQTGSPETHETQSSRVSLVGQTGAGDAVSLLSTGQTTIAGTTGAFQFAAVDLVLGANSLAVQSTDFAGNTNTFSLTVDRQEATGSADLAVQWNQIALNTIQTDASTPIFASRALAIESLAVFDAVSAINGTPGYLLNLSAPADADVRAAVARAAHDALVYLYPAQQATLDASLTAQLTGILDGQSKTDGIAFGATVAAKIIALRANDGWNATVFDEGSTTVGQWRPTGPSFMPALAPQWGVVTPFAMTTSNQFDPAGPPALSSQAYADAVNQTESLGAADSTTRTADQTQIANFWKDGAGTFTPPGHWNNIADQVAQQQGDSLAQNARLLAELNVAEADAGIAAWNTKYSLNTWRPITVIQNADSFGNAGIIQDPTWQPLIVTPNFPGIHLRPFHLQRGSGGDPHAILRHRLRLHDQLIKPCRRHPQLHQLRPGRAGSRHQPHLRRHPFHVLQHRRPRRRTAGRRLDPARVRHLAGHGAAQDRL